MEKRPHLLVVDDDSEIRNLLERFLTKHGFRISTAGDGKEMHKALVEWRIDLVVLDLMLPGEDGLALCRELRAGPDVPVIMLTAMREEIDRIIGLEVGADDYLPKPFNPRELLARIKAVLRRTRREAREPDMLAGGALRFAGWQLDPLARRLTAPDGSDVELTGGEFDLLAILAGRPGRVLSREQLLDLTRGRDATAFDRSIDSQISRLRRKLELDPTRPTIIKTVRSSGYVFTPRVEAL
ncbi:response regulator [Reyranella sp.]|uniref:response regulator n=1 Tax=Reyranella sp. TaxID=1929291 RepID=UPI003D0E8B88